MRILLVSPPLFNAATAYIQKVTNLSTEYPTLGLLYVAASLRSNNPDWKIRVMEIWDFRASAEEIRPVIKEWKPDVVGISVVTSLLYDSLLIARVAKEINPKIHVTFGGFHTYLYPDESVELDAVDSVVIGEGEISFPEIVRRLEKGETLEGIEGVFYKENGGIKRNPRRPFMKDLDSLPFPARDLLSTKRDYACSTDPAVKSTSMISSRGCPFNCAFCCNPEKYYHTRSIPNVIDEMIDCRRQGYKMINFVDETLNTSLKRTKELCDAIIDAKLDIQWSFRGRVDRFDEELAEKLARSGCTRINFGVESGNDEVLKSIRKQATVADARRTLALAKKYGITTVSYLIIGLPDETDEQIEDTIRFALDSKTDFAQFSIPLIFPKTQFYRDAVEQGLLDENLYLSFVRNPTKGFCIPLWTKERSEQELRALQSRAYRRFYMRPSYILARLREVKSISELWRKAKIALYLLYYAITKKRA